MNAAFVDTSAYLALLNVSDASHERAATAFAGLRARKARLVSTSYVLVETYALLGRRFGLDAVKGFRADFVPLMEVIWVDESLHNAALDLLFTRDKRSLSLVDAVSFVTMERTGMNEVFAFDPHFEQEGFTSVS